MQQMTHFFLEKILLLEFRANFKQFVKQTIYLTAYVYIDTPAAAESLHSASSLRKKGAVGESVAAICSGVPVAIICPPFSPPPGPMSMT